MRYQKRNTLLFYNIYDLTLLFKLIFFVVKISGTWHDIIVDAYNSAGKISANYMFSTLTVDGATVSPLIVDDQLNVSITSDFYFLNFLYQYSSLTFVITVFILVVIVSGYIVYIRTKLQRQSMTIDQCKYFFSFSFMF